MLLVAMSPISWPRARDTAPGMCPRWNGQPSCSSLNARGPGGRKIHSRTALPAAEMVSPATYLNGSAEERAGGLRRPEPGSYAAINPCDAQIWLEVPRTTSRMLTATAYTPPIQSAHSFGLRKKRRNAAQPAPGAAQREAKPSKPTAPRLASARDPSTASATAPMANAQVHQALDLRRNRLTTPTTE